MAEPREERVLFDRMSLVQMALVVVVVLSLVLESSVGGPGPLFFLLGAAAIVGLIVTMGLRRAPFIPSRAYRSRPEDRNDASGDE